MSNRGTVVAAALALLVLGASSPPSALQVQAFIAPRCLSSPPRFRTTIAAPPPLRIQHDAVGVAAAAATAAAARRRCCPSYPPTTTTSLSAAAFSPGIGSGGKDNNVRTGVRIAQLLSDPNRRDAMIRQLASSYPLVPSSAIEGVITVASDAFCAAAPDVIERALQPGYLDAHRSEVREPVVNLVVSSDAVKELPLLTTKAKRSLATKLVDLAIDRLLLEADGALTAPEVRLVELEYQLALVKSELGWRRLAWHRAKTNPRKVASLVVGTAAAVLIGSNDVLSASCSKAFNFVSTTAGMALAKVWDVAGLVGRVVAAAVVRLKGLFLPAA